jgi:putative transposase
MPWKECHVMDERLRFVARLLEGETMVALCEEFGISRKTGHKIYQRYRQIGVQGHFGIGQLPRRAAGRDGNDPYGHEFRLAFSHGVLHWTPRA